MILYVSPENRLSSDIIKKMFELTLSNYDIYGLNLKYTNK